MIIRYTHPVYCPDPRDLLWFFSDKPFCDLIMDARLIVFSRIFRDNDDLIDEADADIVLKDLKIQPIFRYFDENNPDSTTQWLNIEWPESDKRKLSVILDEIASFIAFGNVDIRGNTDPAELEAQAEEIGANIKFVHAFSNSQNPMLIENEKIIQRRPRFSEPEMKELLSSSWQLSTFVTSLDEMEKAKIKP